MKLLSIIVPIYNAERYIEECIRSIIDGLSNEIEVLLIDDGSTDRSLEQIKKYQQENVHIMWHGNHGVSYTRNRGIQEAKGKYIMFVDADDRLIKGWEQVVLEACTFHDDVIYFSKYLSGKNMNKENMMNSIFHVPDPEGFKCMMNPVSRIYRLEFLQKHQILFCQDVIHGEDGLFNLEVILDAKCFSSIGKSIYQYRHYDLSSTKRYNPKFFESNLAFLASAETMLTGRVPSQKIERYIGNSFVYNVYLYIFFITKIVDRVQRTNALKTFQDPRMRNLLDRFTSNTDYRLHIKMIYWFVSHHRMECAWLLMNVLNLLRKLRRKEMTWETI